MEKVEAFPISDLGIKLKLQGNLLYHEGPLLSHFVNEDNPNEHYFYKWTDCDDTYNRWLVFRISIENLRQFFDEKINLLQLIKQNPFVYLIDLDNDINQKNVLICQTLNIPEDYLPSENSFFKEIQYEKYALKLKAQLENEAKIAVKENALLEHILEELSVLKLGQNEQRNLLQSILKEKVHETLVDVEEAKHIHRILPVERMVERFEDVEVVVEKIIQRKVPVNFVYDNNSNGTSFSSNETYRNSVPKRRGKANKDNLTLIEGIGPKINELLNNADIWTFEELSYTSVESLRKILEASGNRFKMHNPDTWPAQSALAADSKWDELKAWQDELTDVRK